MSATVFTSDIVDALKETLESIIDDKEGGSKAGCIYPKWMEERSMADAWEDDLEMGGPGLASEVSEGEDIPTGGIREGYMTRYLSRKFGLRLNITEEAIEDNKYDQVLRAAFRLKRSMWKTVDIDCTNILARGFNTAYVGGDGQPLFSASHTLPHGGTFSNLMAVPMSPSHIAITTATSQIRKFPGHDGITEGCEPKDVICPTEQWAVWSEILKSERRPEPGQFNAINVVKSELGLGVVTVKYWSNTTTNWAIKTDCDGGPNLRWRRRPRNRSWVENSNEVMSYLISARWARGWSDPRSMYGVNG